MFSFPGLCRHLLCYLAWAGLAVEGSAQNIGAGEYPNPRREIRHIIPWGAGGATDAAMRGFMRSLEEHLGVPVVTENVAGGLSAVGLIRVRSARPDGYTIGTMTYDVLTLEFQGLAPVSWRDFELIGMVTEHPSVLIAPAERWARLDEFRSAVLAEPGRIKVGNVGTGGIWYQHAAAMERQLGGRLAHVPYEAGSGAQIAALLGGEVDAIVGSLPAALPYVRDGTLRVLAVMSTGRDPMVPDAPTFRELGYDLVFGGFRVVVAPKGMPPAIVERLEAAVEAASRDPGFQAWSARAAIGAMWRNREDTREYLGELAAKVDTLMEELGLRGEEATNAR
jgi:tripartite-type tricarboxylate transporter receptor subunit TctC